MSGGEEGQQVTTPRSTGSRTVGGDSAAPRSRRGGKGGSGGKEGERIAGKRKRHRDRESEDDDNGVSFYLFCDVLWQRFRARILYSIKCSCSCCCFQMSGTFEEESVMLLLSFVWQFEEREGSVAAFRVVYQTHEGGGSCNMAQVPEKAPVLMHTKT